jgi:hypothetical protein
MDLITQTTDVLVALQEFDNQVQAEIAKSILDSAGIFCVLHGEYMSSIYTPVAFPTRLMVRPEDVETANVLLSASQA